MQTYSTKSAENFAQLVAAARAAPAVTIYRSQTNRKWDRIVAEEANKPTRTLFFVARASFVKKVRKLVVNVTAGDIFGPKSNAAPNLARYYGHIDNASLWEWVNEPAPISDASVIAVRTYGNATHYAKKI